MNTRLTRRDLGLAVAAAAASVAAEAQNQPAQNADALAAVREANARNSQTLAKFEIPISTEPAFQFRA